MSLQALHDQFVEEAKSGQILIDAAAIARSGLTPSAGLDALLTGAFMLPGSGLKILQPANISPVADNKFTLTGTIDTPVAKNKAVSASFTTDGNVAVFSIVVTLGATWKFKDSFKYMAGKVYDALPLANQIFVFSTRAESDFPVGGRPIALKPGLNLSADITLTGILAKLVDLFSGLLPNIARQFSGPLDPAQIGTKTPSGKTILVPGMDLRADLGIASYQFSFLTLERPFLRFVTQDYGPEFGPVPVLTADAELKIQGGNPVTFEATLPLSGATYSFAVFGSNGGLILSPRQLFDLMGGRTWYDVIPPQLLQFLGSFGPKMFNANIIAKPTPKLIAVSSQVGSDPNQHWTFLDGLFTLDSFDVWWTILSPLSEPTVTATFSSAFVFFPQVFPGKFIVSITSDLVVSGSYAGTVKFADIVAALTNSAVRIPTQFNLEFYDFGVEVDTRGNSYSLWGGTTLTLNLFGGIKFGIEDVSFSLATFPAGGSGNPGNNALVSQVRADDGTAYSAAIEGSLVLGPVYLDASLAYEDGLWTASLGTQPDEEISLQALIDEIFDSVKLPIDWFEFDVKVSNLLLEAEVQTGTKGRNLYKASADFVWHFKIWEISFDPLATVKLQYDSTGKPQAYTGSVDAIIQFQLFGIGTIFGVRYAIENQDGKAKETIALSWEGLVAAYEKTGTNEKIVFTAGPDWSLGRLITSMVRLIAPSAVRNLPSPWSLLNDISLAGLRVEFDLGTKKVTVSWPIKLKLFFLTLERVDISKTPGQQVEVQLVGSYLGGQPIPSWNAVTQDPPEVPGGGDSAFNLKLLAIGQRVTIPGLAAIKTVGDAVDALKKFAQPAPDSKKIPVGTNPTSGNPIYAADNHLLLGAHFLALSNCIEIKLIFNDPGAVRPAH